MNLIRSKNPQSEGKLYSVLALVFGIMSVIAWMIGILAIAFGIRGAVLSRRVGLKKHFVFALVGIGIGALSILAYFIVQAL